MISRDNLTNRILNYAHDTYNLDPFTRFQVTTDFEGTRLIVDFGDNDRRGNDLLVIDRHMDAAQIDSAIIRRIERYRIDDWAAVEDDSLIPAHGHERSEP